MTTPALAVSGSCCTDDWPFSAAVRRDGEVALAVPGSGERGDLAALVRRACAAAGLAVGDVREVRVDHGPGSYVGLRVAVTLARFLCAFTPARLCAVDSLVLIAAATLAAGVEATGTIRPVVDARRGRLHTSRLRLDTRGLLVTEQRPCVVPQPEFLAGLQPGDLVIAPTALAALLAPVAPHTVIRPASPVHAGHLFAPTLQVREYRLEELEPLYLMGSYAS